MSFRAQNLEALESRTLLAAVYPTVYEQYMVELHNWARANPAAAAARYGIALNEGPPSSTITTDPKQPLAINPFLTDAARSYAQYMLDVDVFSHTADGRNPSDRMSLAGYVFSGSWGTSESCQLHAGSFVNMDTAMDTDFAGYYTDLSVPGRGHRINIFIPDLKEVGSGLATGNWQGYNAYITVLDYAWTNTTFLTGVAYADSSHNNFYTPGEQMGGVSIVAIRESDGAQFTTTTWSSGGYSLALPDGTYTVWGSGGSLGGWVRYDDVSIAGQNVKRDFRPDFANSGGPSDPPAELFATLANGKLNISGTPEDDVITLVVNGGSIEVTRNDLTVSFDASKVKSVSILGGDGADEITLGALSMPATINGGSGNDSIQGGMGNDIVYGGAGNDRLLGGSRNDRLFGQDGNDSLFGQTGDDLLDGGGGADLMSGGRNIDVVDYASRGGNLYVEISSNYAATTGKSGYSGEKDHVLDDTENIAGGSGNDRLIGSSFANVISGNAGSDTIYGMNGTDTLLGGSGNDRFFTSDLAVDSINGGAGRDTVSGDDLDLLTSIES